MTRRAAAAGLRGVREGPREAAGRSRPSAAATADGERWRRIGEYAIAALFFIAGVGLPVGILKDAAGDGRRQRVFPRSHSYSVFPVALAAVAVPELVSFRWVDPRTGNGLFILAALPTTVGSASRLRDRRMGTLALRR